jgi:DNA-directed RNA polymerase sigma subunit (sigma70/sigma32)
MVEEIAEAAELPLEQVIDLQDVARIVTSLHRPAGEGDEAGLEPISCPRRASRSTSRCTSSSPRRPCGRTVRQLPDREREVIELRFGLNGEKESLRRCASRSPRSNARNAPIGASGFSSPSSPSTSAVPPPSQ